MNHLPPQGFSYYVDNINQYHFQAIVPYSAYNYRIEVISPVNPYIAPTYSELPPVTLKDFNIWVQSANILIDDENSVMFHMFRLLIDIARDVVRFNIIREPLMYKRVVSYYVAHYLELHLKQLKDEEERMSLSPQEKSKEDKDELQLSLISSEFGDFKKTLWGQMYWSLYGGTSAKYVYGFNLY